MPLIYFKWFFATLNRFFAMLPCVWLSWLFDDASAGSKRKIYYICTSNHTCQMSPEKTEIAPRSVELLAPARNLATGIAAIDHGADAVYIGPPSHGARHQAANSIEDIKALAAYAHRFGARVYVTVNTIVYDSEIPQVERLVRDLYAAGVDALIVQDMALLQMDIPPIALHASTQCDIRTPSKAGFLQNAGFAQLVLPRELTLQEIAEIHAAVDVPLEAFVHGALCVSYSGDCQASYCLTGRSANRGECAQICRLPFDLEDAEGRRLIRGRHLLSLKDMNRSEMIADMLQAGISSFKIEGRLKDENYVKNVVAAYRRAIDAVIGASPSLYRRSSMGFSELTFTPDLSKSFNRGFTSYFLTARRPQGSMATFASPKWTGEEVGRLKGQLSPRRIRIKATRPLANGDGLGFYDDNGTFVGFRLNRVDGDTLHLAADVTIPPGAVIYRNYSKEWADIFTRPSARRLMQADFTLGCAGSALALSMSLADNPGLTVTVTAPYEPQEARTPQKDARRNTLSRLGDTEFCIRGCTDSLDNFFVPASLLTSLRRDVVEAMRSLIAARHSFDRRRPEMPGLCVEPGYAFSRHDNIANSLAARFYADRSGGEVSASRLPAAIEVGPAPKGELRVMQTRYCLRRELGACLRTPEGARYPSPLFLTSGGNRFRLDFDCRNCTMNVIRL